MLQKHVVVINQEMHQRKRNNNIICLYQKFSPHEKFLIIIIINII